MGCLSCCTVSSDDGYQWNPPAHNITFPHYYFFLVFGLLLLCLFIVQAFPFLWSWGQELTSSNTSKVRQIGSLLLRNLRNMFVSELVVLDSVISFFRHCLELCYLTRTLDEDCIGVVSIMLKCIFAQEENCTEVFSYVYDTLCRRCWCYPGSQILADSGINNHQHFCLCCYLFENLEQLWLSFSIYQWSKTDVICWLSRSRYNIPQKSMFDRHSLPFAMITKSSSFCEERTHSIHVKSLRPD